MVLGPPGRAAQWTLRTVFLAAAHAAMLSEAELVALYGRAPQRAAGVLPPPLRVPRDATQTLRAAAPTFYVSADGDDAASGTSPSTPWRTLVRAGVGAGSALRAGAALLLRGGDVFTLTAPLRFDGVGNETSSAGPRALFGSWGDAAERPVVAAAAASQAGPLLWLADAARCDVRGWELRGGEAGVALSFSASMRADATISDCIVRDARAANLTNEGGDWGGAFIFAATRALVTVAGVTLRNNAVEGCDTLLREAAPATWGALTVLHLAELVVEGNFATRTWGNTVGLNWVLSARVTRNVLLRNGPPPGVATPRGTTDFILGAVPPAVVVDGNEVGWRGEGAGAPDGCALDFEVASQNITIVGNYFHHSFGAAFLIFGHGTTSTGLVLANNTLIQNGCNQTSWDRGELALAKPNSSGTFLGNTVIHSCGPYVTPHWPSSAAGWSIRDNAVDGLNATLSVLPAPTLVVRSPSAGIVLDASCASCPPGVVLRFTTDGSRPSAASPQWPPAGGLTLPPRTVVVLVKALPPPSSDGGGAPPQLVEGPAEGGIFVPR